MHSNPQEVPLNLDFEVCLKRLAFANAKRGPNLDFLSIIKRFSEEAMKNSNYGKSQANEYLKKRKDPLALIQTSSFG